LQDNTNRPPILPGKEAGLQQQLIGGAGQVAGGQFASAAGTAAGQLPTDYYQRGIVDIANQLAGQQALANLDPVSAQRLAEISGAEQARLSQQFSDAQSQLLARLYGSGVQRSSIAGENIGRLLQQQGLVQQQQLSDAASREIALRQFLTQQQLQGRQSAIAGLGTAAGAQQAQLNPFLDLLSSLAGQGTQRDIAAGQLGLGQQELAERARQANLQFELGQQEQDRLLAQQGSLFNKILAGLQVGGQLAGGIGGVLGGIGALRTGTGGTTR
jgi:hypothetical protein